LVCVYIVFFLIVFIKNDYIGFFKQKMVDFYYQKTVVRACRKSYRSTILLMTKKHFYMVMINYLLDYWIIHFTLANQGLCRDSNSETSQEGFEQKDKKTLHYNYLGGGLSKLPC